MGAETDTKKEVDGERLRTWHEGLGALSLSFKVAAEAMEKTRSPYAAGLHIIGRMASLAADCNRDTAEGFERSVEKFEQLAGSVSFMRVFMNEDASPRKKGGSTTAAVALLETLSDECEEQRKVGRLIREDIAKGAAFLSPKG
jgi:hypothetical protein